MSVSFCERRRVEVVTPASCDHELVLLPLLLTIGTAREELLLFSKSFSAEVSPVVLLVFVGGIFQHTESYHGHSLWNSSTSLGIRIRVGRGEDDDGEGAGAGRVVGSRLAIGLKSELMTFSTIKLQPFRTVVVSKPNQSYSFDKYLSSLSPLSQCFAKLLGSFWNTESSSCLLFTFFFFFFPFLKKITEKK